MFRFPAGDAIPGSAESVVSGDVAIDSAHRLSGNLRLRYFGPRPLVEDDMVRSRATSLLNGELDYRFARNAKIAVDVFHILNAQDSDIDYYYRSRLVGEAPGGVEDIHFHPVLPRTARVHLILGF